MTTTAHAHFDYCLPRPGETEPRTETYRVDRPDDTGRVVARPVVWRCMECGAHEVDGVAER